MNCRDFLAEFEERCNVLSQPAQLHMNDCPGCKKTSGEQTRVWQMVDGLQRIDAPNDFDFRVKAKIAGAKPADFQSRFLPVLRYVLPLGLVVLIFGLLAFNTSFFFGNNASREVAEAPIPQTSEREIAPTNSLTSNQTVASNATNRMLLESMADANVEPSENNQEKQFVAAKLPSKPRKNFPKKNVKDNFVGWRDLSATKQNDKYPINLNPNQTVETLPNGSNSNPVSDEEILEFLGVGFIRESGNLKVKTVKENSLAARSGVKIGDVIEELNGVKLSARPLRIRQTEVKKMTVSRGAEKIEIILEN